MQNQQPIIETPFNKRHHCWFCGEPNKHVFTFPHAHYLVINCCHPELAVPCCTECYGLARKAEVNTIWQVNSVVKKGLIQLYKKDLAIGINWTQQELAESEFDGGNFEGFKRSAWFMFEVAKNRVNYNSWPIVLNGVVVEPEDEDESFIFDGIEYPNIDAAISHYAETFYLHKAFLKEAVLILGVKSFAAAVRFCRLHIDSTPYEKNQAIKSLTSAQ